MPVPPREFSRITGRVDVERLQGMQVAIIGVGTVGSHVASELARSGIGRLLLVDHDEVDLENLPRHALTRQYLGWNKAEALALQLAGSWFSLTPRAFPRRIDASLTDSALDGLLCESSLIVAATDDRATQRRVARRGLALDTPVIVPALYGNDGGEVFVQRSPRNPCFLCWDAFRPEDQQPRGVTALSVDTMGVIALAVSLALGVLDPSSDFRRSYLAIARDDPRPPQLFVQRPMARLAIAPVPWRPNCQSCAVGPAASDRTRRAAMAPGQVAGRTQRVGRSLRWVVGILAIGALICGGVGLAGRLGSDKVVKYPAFSSKLVHGLPRHPHLAALTGRPLGYRFIGDPGELKCTWDHKSDVVDSEPMLRVSCEHSDANRPTKGAVYDMRPRTARSHRGIDATVTCKQHRDLAFCYLAHHHTRLRFQAPDQSTVLKGLALMAADVGHRTRT